MNKLKVNSVGVSVDVSYQSGDKEVKCYMVPCKGTIDGSPSDFKIKIYGKGGDQRIKEGIECKGEFGSYNNEDFYTVKKANNEHLFSHSGGGGGGNYSGGGKGGYTPQHELNGMRIATDIVMKHFEAVPGDKTPEQLAHEAVSIATKVVVPYLRKVSVRHDEEAAKEEKKKAIREAVKQMLESNGLAENIRAHSVKMSTLIGMYEKSGQDGARFIADVKAEYPAKPADPADDDYDDIPF